MTVRYDSMGFKSKHGIWVRWVDHEAVVEALRQLHRECVHAGFDTAKDFNWPKAMKDASDLLTVCGFRSDR